MNEIIAIIIGVILAIFGILFRDNKKKTKLITEQKDKINRNEIVIQMHEKQSEIVESIQTEIKEIEKKEDAQIEEIKQADNKEALDIANTIVDNFNKRNASKLQNP